MRNLRPAELRSLPLEELRPLVLLSRPEPGSVRTSWWLGLIEQLIAEVRRGDSTNIERQIENVGCALRVIEVLDESSDLPASGPATMMVDLRTAVRASMRDDHTPDELGADRLASRCLAAMPVDKAKVPGLVRRERRYLVDGLGQPELSDAEFQEFNRLDEVRTVLRALKRLRPDISDSALSEAADEWVAIDPMLHGQ